MKITKYGASSSLLILEFDTVLNRFKVLKRYEMPKAEYSYDNAVNKIIELNEIYNPSWIYCDRGSGEYQIERLHIYGEEHPESGLKQKVVGWSFSNKIKVIDPATGEEDNKAMKPFMVSQLQIAFERESIILSPYDEVLYKQLIDYEVDKIGQNGVPTFTSKNEHFVDALGLAYLAMVMEFKQLTGVMKDLDVEFKMEISSVNITENSMLKSGNTSSKPMKPEVKEFWENTDFTELRGERQVWVKTDFSDFNSSEYSNYSNNSVWSRNTGSGGWGR